MSDRTEISLLFFAIYSLWLLLPLVPSVIIYRMFPDTKVTAEGEVSNWKIKSGGAFAAYLAVLMAGYVLIDRAQLNTLLTDWRMWTLAADVELRDKNGKPVQIPQLFNQLEISSQPDVILKKGLGKVDVVIPVQGNDPPNVMMTFKISEFGQADVHLGRPSRTRTIDPKHRLITDTIVIEQEQPYVQAAYMTSANP